MIPGIGHALKRDDLKLSSPQAVGQRRRKAVFQRRKRRGQFLIIDRLEEHVPERPENNIQVPFGDQVGCRRSLLFKTLDQGREFKGMRDVQNRVKLES